MVARTSKIVRATVASSTLLYDTQEKNAFHRQVTFKEEPEIAPNRSPLERLADRNRIWYQEREMKAFRSEAKELSLFIKRHKKCNRDCPVLCCMMATKDGCTRGLEQRVCLERQRRRYLGNRGIIAAHKSMQYSPDRLARLASKCNRWASRIAVAEAAHDFFQAYDNDEKRDSDPIIENGVTIREQCEKNNS